MSEVKNKIFAHDGLAQQETQEPWLNIIRLALPETISAMLLVFLPIAFDLYFVSSLKHTISYQALGISTNVLHLLLKTSEAISISVSTKIGFYNGAENYKMAGHFIINSLFAAIILGSLQIILILLGVNLYLSWIGASLAIVPFARSFLQIQSIAILFSFIFMSLIGFFRGIKNTFVPLCANILGVVVFLLFDYILIFGKFGAPAMGLQGSAIASVLRYLFACVFLLAYLYYSDIRKSYLKNVRIKIDSKAISQIIVFALPVMIDKSVIAVAYMWLYKLIIPLSAYALLAMEVIKNFERLVFVPVHALAQVTNTLLSNNLGEGNFGAAWQNLRRTLFAAIIVVTCLLLFLAFNAKQLVAIFDPQNLFRDEATFVLRCVSGLVILDACQVIFAAALRTFGHVYTVMATRILFFLLFYLPASLLLNLAPCIEAPYKLLMFYGFFYLTIAMIGSYFFTKVYDLLSPAYSENSPLEAPNYH